MVKLVPAPCMRGGLEETRGREKSEKPFLLLDIEEGVEVKDESPYL